MKSTFRVMGDGDEADSNRIERLEQRIESLERWYSAVLAVAAGTCLLLGFAAGLLARLANQ